MEQNKFYYLLTKYRMSIFGLSAIWIFFRHTFFYNCFTYGLFDPIVRIGDCGVDVFLFLSSFGLYFSYKKNPVIKCFYKKRIIRILPTTIVLLLLLSFIDYSIDKWDINQLLSVKFWIGLIYSKYWFIGAILFLYFIYPFLCNMVMKRSKMMIFISIIIGFFGIFLVKICHVEVLNQLVVYFARFPVFVLGIVFSNKLSLFENNKSIIALFLISIILLVSLPKDYSRMVYMFVVIFVIRYIPILLDKMPNIVNQFLAKIGKASLEFYLIHVALFSTGILSLVLSASTQTIAVLVSFFVVYVSSISFNKTFDLINKKLA